MAAITFLNPGMKDRVKITLGPGPAISLLALAKAMMLPLRCQCESGQCGACAVKVVPLRGRVRGEEVRLGEREKTLLFQEGKLSQQQYEAELVPDMPPLWRLACQYQVKDEDILVAF